MAPAKAEVIQTPNAPAAIGPYSQARKVGNMLFVSGQIPFDPATGALVTGDVSAEAKQVIKNLSAILAAAGADLSNVVKTTIFLKSMNDFNAVNEVYASMFPSPFPARSTVEVAALPRGVRVEIEAIAFLI